MSSNFISWAYINYNSNRGQTCKHIPNEFVIEHGPNLGDSVLLEVPNGVAWKVKLLNSSGMVWLNEGWNKFKEYYSIACCYFLLFRYEGNFQFSLFIFDLNASEIEYPPGQNEDMTPQNRSVLCVPPEESGINLPLLGEPPNENRINLTPPDDPPEEDVIYLSPPGIYTIMAKGIDIFKASFSLSFRASQCILRFKLCTLECKYLFYTINEFSTKLVTRLPSIMH
nr:uncharacterized protein LOC104649657 isoform X2 [Solanum lycopersicum]